MKYIISLLLMFLTAICDPGTLVGQNSESKRRYVVDSKRPAVYLSNEVIKRDTLGMDVGRENERVFFRLHNNLKWGIRITVSPAAKAEGEAKLDYDILRPDAPVLEARCHVCTYTIVNSAETILFSLPRSQVEDTTILRIRYSYAWENTVDAETRREPSHFVFLRLDGTK